MTVSFVDLHGFAGGLTLGGVQAGMTLLSKHESSAMGGFGMANCDNNRHLLGMDWRGQVSAPSAWDPPKAEIVLACPPCSGFSSMSWGVNRETYGIKAKVNSCMWDVIAAAGKVAPKVLVMESVQAAAVTGLPLMRELRADLEARTGKQYWMYHVLQNNGALGGCSIRRRYFLVLSQIPFGVELPDFGPPHTLRDAIGDLQGLDYTTMGRQQYVAPAHEWLHRNGMINPDGWVDGHCIADPENRHKTMSRQLDLMKGDTEDVKIWPQNRCLVWALRTYYDTHGELPASWRFTGRDGRRADESLIAKNFEMGFTRPKRWVYDLPSRVIIGGAMYLVIHPEQDRFLTHRECARIMGFPDSWMAEPMKDVRGLAETWGKGVSVQSGKWVARWAKDAVEGRPGSVTGVPVTEHHRLGKHGFHDRESVIDVSQVPKQNYPVKTERGFVIPMTVAQEDGEPIAA